MENKKTLPLDQLRSIRIEKLNKIKKLGINPFASKSNRTNTAKEILDNFEKFNNKQVVVAGRLVSFREHGELVFCDISNQDAEIQLYIHKNDLEPFNKISGNLGAKNLYLLDLGDFIEAKGLVTKTQRGVISVAPTQVRLLTKSIRPLPSKHFGIKDEEERYRQRYVELALNPELRELFVKKAMFWNSIRDFMINSGFLEVETPVLENTAGGADANPFVTHHNALDIDVYLRISMGELWQKRLMVGGFEKTFELGRQFRNEGISREHLQDYTQMEFYWAYANYKDGMDLVEKMYKEVLYKTFGTYKFEINGHKIDLNKKWEELDYSKAVLEGTGVDINKASTKDIKNKLDELGVKYEKDLNKGRLVDYLWKQVRKTISGPVFLVGHPKQVSPLAKSDMNNPNFVQRFQPIIAGSELGNGYSELNDPIDQTQRFEEQQKARDAGDEEAQMHDEDFVRALEYGMPPVCGFGISERVFAFFANKSVRECVIFPLLRPESFNVSDENNTVQEEFNVNLESKMNKKQAIELLEKNMQNVNLRRHCYGVGFAMNGLYTYIKENNWKGDSPDNKETWEVFGILHDSDYEITKDDWSQHTLVAQQWLKELGVSEDDPIYKGLESHGSKLTGRRGPQTQMEWALECVDELTGFIVAVALVKPDKSLASVDVKSVTKKWKQKAFAPGVHREQIEQCEEKLDIPLDTFIEVTLKAMQKNSKELGL